jgi:hypothetical protein
MGVDLLKFKGKNLILKVKGLLNKRPIKLLALF